MGKKLKNKAIFYLIILILILITFTSLFFYAFFKNRIIEKTLHNPNIYNNIYVENINISNLSFEDALVFLKNEFQPKEEITIKYNDKEFIYNKEDLGLEYNFEETIRKAYEIGRIGEKRERYIKIKELNNTPENLKLEYTLDEEKMNLAISELEKTLNKEPIRASLIKEGENFRVIPGENGFALNREKLISDLKNALNEEGASFISIEMNEISNNSEDLELVKDKLGTYITSYKGSPNSNRVINMKRAAENINGTVLYPGEVFSTNKMFKPTTKENGYKPATTIINGKLVDEYGGGVCQVSSTLYNALLYSELEILERRNHSLKVGYLDYGYDATLAADYIDLKFKNSTKYPIYIEAYLTGDKVICNIYGKDDREKNRSLKFENVLVEEIQPGPRIEKETSELALGTEKISVEAELGYKYKLYKLVYIDGKLKDKVLVNTSYYKPKKEEVLIGNNKNLAKPAINSNDNSYKDNKKEEVFEINTQKENIEIQIETSFEEISDSIETTEEYITEEYISEETTEKVIEKIEEISEIITEFIE